MNPWTIIGWIILGAMAFVMVWWLFFGLLILWQEWLKTLDQQRRTIKKIEDHTP